MASKTEFNLGAAFSAATTDIATEYILGKSYNNLERTDFDKNLMNMLQGSGGMWRVTKHIRFFGPLFKAMPLSMLEKTGDPGVQAFVAFLKVCPGISRYVFVQCVTGDTDTIPIVKIEN